MTNPDQKTAQIQTPAATMEPVNLLADEQKSQQAEQNRKDDARKAEEALHEDAGDNEEQKPIIVRAFMAGENFEQLADGLSNDSSLNNDGDNSDNSETNESVDDAVIEPLLVGAQPIIMTSVAVTTSIPSLESIKSSVGHTIHAANQNVAMSFNVTRNVIAGRLTDVKGNSNDPFIQILGAHDHKGEVGGLGYRSNIYGIAGGLDFVNDLNSGAQFRYGVITSFTKVKTKFFGNSMTDNKKSSSQDVIFTGVFGAYENFNEKGLKTNLNLLTGVGFSNNKISRIDHKNNLFSAKYHSSNFSACVELIKNLGMFHGVQVGPWVSASYNHIRQKSYKESGAKPDLAIGMDKTRSNSIETILGLSMEKEFQNPTNQHKRIKLFAKAGWAYAAKQSNSARAFEIGSQSINFTPTFGNHSKHSAILNVGFRNKISQHIDITGSVTGQFNRKNHFVQAAVGIGYSF